MLGQAEQLFRKKQAEDSNPPRGSLPFGSHLEGKWAASPFSTGARCWTASLCHRSVPSGFWALVPNRGRDRGRAAFVERNKARPTRMDPFERVPRLVRLTEGLEHRERRPW